MAVEERSRRSRYDLLKEPLGMDATHALLDELPPIGADLATKDDIDALEDRFAAELSLLRAEVGRQLAEIASQIAESKAQLSTMLIGVMLGMLGLIVALVVSLATLT